MSELVTRTIFGIRVSDTDVLLLDENNYTKYFLDAIRLDVELDLFEINLSTDDTVDIIELYLEKRFHKTDIRFWYLEFASIVSNSIELFNKLKHTINTMEFKSYVGNFHPNVSDINPYIKYLNIRLRQGGITMINNIDNLSVEDARDIFDGFIEYKTNTLHGLTSTYNNWDTLSILNKNIISIKINKDYLDNNTLDVNQILIDNKITPYNYITNIKHNQPKIPYLHTLVYDFLIRKAKLKKRYNMDIRDSVNNLVRLFGGAFIPETDSLLFEIDGNIIITHPKIASTTCCNIVHNRYNGDFKYTDVRFSSSYVIKKVNDILIPHFDSHENTIVVDTKNTFNDIISNKSNKKLYILIRNPIIRWIQSVKEDLRIFFYDIQKDHGNDILFNLLISFLDKDGVNIDRYLKYIDKLKTDEQHRIVNNHTFQLEHLFTTTTSDSDTYLNNFHKELFLGIWNYFLNPKTQYDEYNTIPNWNVSNIITMHYNPYLVTYWTWYNELNKPNYIEFVDVDNTEFDLIKIKNTDTHRYDNDYVDSKTNITPRDFKKCFYDTFVEVIQNSDKNPHLLNYIRESLKDEVMIYKTILKQTK